MKNTSYTELLQKTIEDKTGIQKPFLNWEDISIIFSCKRSKALLIMHQLQPIRIGRSLFVKTSDLISYLEKHHGIDVAWPDR